LTGLKRMFFEPELMNYLQSWGFGDASAFCIPGF
jgi:hypothetical protein